MTRHLFTILALGLLSLGTIGCAGPADTIVRLDSPFIPPQATEKLATCGVVIRAQVDRAVQGGNLLTTQGMTRVEWDFVKAQVDTGLAGRTRVIDMEDQELVDILKRSEEGRVRDADLKQLGSSLGADHFVILDVKYTPLLETGFIPRKALGPAAVGALIGGASVDRKNREGGVVGGMVAGALLGGWGVVVEWTASVTMRMVDAETGQTLKRTAFTVKSSRPSAVPVPNSRFDRGFRYGRPGDWLRALAYYFTSHDPVAELMKLPPEQRVVKVPFFSLVQDATLAKSLLDIGILTKRDEELTEDEKKVLLAIQTEAVKRIFEAEDVELDDFVKSNSYDIALN